MNSKFSIVRVAALVTALFLFGVGYATPVATTQITYGTLDNFDVINDTGGECHGFEIELEGIASSDVAYTFGSPYQRYGDPTIVPTVTGTGVIIRYAAGYDSSAHTWSATTPFTAPPYLPTEGHSCWTGGVSDPAIYYNSGCDHFGASLNATPTKTTYRWLVESAPGSGMLTPFGSNATLPAPVWNVTPPAVPGGQPVAAAAIAPPAPAPGVEFGEALWAKVYVTELPDGLHAEDLDHLVIDDPNMDIVPNEPVEVEFEWVLMQARAGNPGEQEFGGAAEVGAGNDAVSRRFEFYKYTGQYDAETHEALCDNPIEAAQQTAARCGTPDADGVAGVGNLIGAQNVAINLLGPVVVIPENHPPVAQPNGASTDEDVAVTISRATLLANDTDRDLDPLTIDSVQDAVGGTAALSGAGVVFTPSLNFNGPAGFTYTISDGKGGTSTGMVSVAVSPVNDPPVANAGVDQSVRMHEKVFMSGSGLDVDSPLSSLTFSWTFDTVPAHGKAALSGATSVSPTFKADKAGTYTATLVVNDGTVNSAPATVTITATKGRK